MNGFVKVAAAAPNIEVANCTENIRRIESVIRKAEKLGVQVIVFPELSVTGYTCMDLFAQDTLLHHAKDVILQLIEKTKKLNVLCAVGIPLAAENKLFNTAVVFQNGRILGVIPKSFIPNYKEFQEMRWFSSGSKLQSETIRIGDEEYPFGTNLLFSAKNAKAVVGIEICEDLWTPVPPSSTLSMSGANIILNLSASNEIIGKNQYLRSLIAQQSARCIAGYAYASAGFGESSTDLVYTGKGFIAENGVVLSESERFDLKDKLIINDINIDYLQHDRLVNTSFAPQLQNESLSKIRNIPFDLAPHKSKPDRFINPHPFVPSEDGALKDRCEEIFNIQTFGLVQRLKHIRAKSAVIGISGGLDSSLALMVTVRAFDTLNIPRKNIHGVTMPGFGTTGRTYKNAASLIKSIGVSFHEISIKDACIQHFKDIGHDGKTTDVTYENTQARERTQILMDLANQTNGVVIGTGDMSELALGWATYNGDHMSMYGVNVGIPKTLVRYLVEWTANNISDKKTRKTLLDIADTPISPELIPANEDGTIRQRTEDFVGPYELHDFFLYHFMRFGASPGKILFLARQAFHKKYSDNEIKKWLQTFLRRFFSQQFKRSCLPDGPKVGSISLSPRSDWRMPSDASVDLWLNELENKSPV
ncbi:MAG: NAD(+) synthase [Tannerella sp.]|jgi:NAD+ synthase (glutamine-hydrolysing)|nr:NAD(+) synthase [Tannerella sp.]